MQIFRTAKLLENVVRSEGSEPATIALMDGRIHVGLSEESLARVAGAEDTVKVSRRDIAHALSKVRCYLMFKAKDWNIVVP